MGWAQAQLGRPGEGVSIIRQGLDSLAEVGAKLAITDWFTRLAEAQALDGKIEDALGTLEGFDTADLKDAKALLEQLYP